MRSSYIADTFHLPETLKPQKEDDRGMQFVSVYVVLEDKGVTANEIFKRIIKTERDDHPIVRAIIDESIGIARVHDGNQTPPWRKNVLHLLTKEPGRAIEVLHKTGGVAFALKFD